MQVIKGSDILKLGEAMAELRFIAEALSEIDQRAREKQFYRRLADDLFKPVEPRDAGPVEPGRPKR